MALGSEQQEAETASVIKAYAQDPILAARQLLPHWFLEPMPWFHRGLIAIFLRRADFLLNFGEEYWPEGTGRWTKKKLAKLVKHFRYPINPADPKSKTAPIFRIRYKEDGRTPEAIDMVLGDHVVLIIPRGFSKTTIVNFVNIYKTLYKLTKFTVYVSEAGPHAETQLATIQRELSGNERIVALYGQLKPDRADDESWGAKKFETKTGVKFQAKGRGSQIRGLNQFSDRPDTIVLDDVEDKESVETDTQREKVLSWYISDVGEALPRGREGCIYALGTMLHPKALLPTLAKSSEYTAITLGAEIPTGEFIDTGAKNEDGTPKLKPVMEALWDSKYGLTLDKIEIKRQQFAQKGKLYEFGLEILSKVRDEDKLKFKSEYIRYRQFTAADFVARSIHVDPAISTQKDADYFSIAVVGVTDQGHKHVCDWFGKKGMPFSEQAEKYFEMKMAWDCTIHSCESSAYQAALAQSIRSLMFAKAKVFGSKAYFEIKETWPAKSKLARVEGILQPLMSSGYLTFQKIWPELEIMFNDWPNEKLDGPDAIAGAVANLDPYAALSYGDGTALEKEDLGPPDYQAPCPAGSGQVP